MRFLVDNSISPYIAQGLSNEGHDAVHVLSYQMSTGVDEDIIDRAFDEGRIAITYDLDFPKILALRPRAKPSVIIFRKLRRPPDQPAALLGNLDRLRVPLDQGCLAVVEPDRIRIRDLPLGRGAPEDA